MLLPLLICLLSIVVTFVVLVKNKKQFIDDIWLESPFFRKTLFISIVLLAVAFIQPYRAERINQGFGGLKVWYSGQDRGAGKIEYKVGWTLYNYWSSSLKEFPTNQQHKEYPQQTVITKGGFPVDIKPSFNYTIKTGEMASMYREFRSELTELEDKWLLNALLSVINDVSNKWSIEDVFSNREKFELEVVVECNRRLNKWFNISQLRTNIIPPPALVKSINDKTTAIQDVQLAENRRKVAEAKAFEKIAIARGDSAAAVIAAAGEAEAIKRKQVTLTPLYIEYIRAERWNGSNATTIAGVNSPLLITPSKQ